MVDEVDRLIEDLKAHDWRTRWRAAGGLGKIGDARAIDPLIQALKDNDSGVRWRAAEALEKIRLIEDLKAHDWRTRWRAAEALGNIGDGRAVAPLIKSSNDQDGDVRKAAEDALEKILQHLPNITKEKRATILCSDCFCRFTEHKAQLGFLKSFSYYACPNCHGLSFIDNVGRVVAVLEYSLYKSYTHTDTTLVVNWYSHKEPFDFDEIRIIDANDFDIDELVMKLRNDMDDKRRKSYKSLPVYLSTELQISQAKMNMIKDTFGRVEKTE